MRSMFRQSGISAITATVIGLALTLVPLVSSARVFDFRTPPEPFVIPGRVLVQLEENIDPVAARTESRTVSFGRAGLDRLSQRFEMHSTSKVFPWRVEKPPVNSGLHDLSRFYVLHIPDTLDPQQVVDSLLLDTDVRHAELVWAMPLAYVVPDDPDFGNQWYMNTMKMTSAWNLETGSDSIKVAVIDAGVNFRHPDLTQHIWVNSGEDIDGDFVVYDYEELNGIDDDSNGVVDDLIGYDFFTGLESGVISGEDGGVPDSDPNDYDGHGTFIAGVLAAVTNNTKGIAGMAGGWYDYSPITNRGIRIICLRAGGTAPDGDGYVNSVDCATAMDYAVMMGAHVINCSWRGNSNQLWALENALISGATVVHAAGNFGSDDPDFMDLIFDEAVLSVASTRVDDKKSWFSNYGEWVDVSAPGEDIYSTVSVAYEPGYIQWDGTSFSAPMVSGLAALIRSMMPSLSREEVDSIIINSADNIDSLNPTYAGLLGSGRINPYRALASLANAKFEATVYDGNVPLVVYFSDMSPNLAHSWTWDFGDGTGSTQRNPGHLYNVPGTYSVSLIVEERLGVGEEHVSNLIWVRADTMTVGSVPVYSGDRFSVPVSLTNTSLIEEIVFSFSMENDVGVSLVDLSVEGTRSEGYFKRQMTGYSGLRREYTLKPIVTGSSKFLPPGSGPVFNLIIDVDSASEAGSSVTIDTLTWIAGHCNIRSIWGDFWPAFIAGGVEVQPCCGRFTNGLTGNANCSDDGKVTLSDIAVMIDRVFASKEPLCCEASGNTNGSADGKITLSDITRAIDQVFVTKVPSEPCR